MSNPDDYLAPKDDTPRKRAWTTFVGLLNNKAAQISIYRDIRKRFPHIGPMCAATCSAYLVMAGILKVYMVGTQPLYQRLINLGWTRGNNMRNLMFGDIVFTLDLIGKKGWPDHVYIWLRWADAAKQTAWILDNYAATPHIRNLGRGPRTPYGFHMRHPESK
jgi:hypothetical protein